MGDTGSKEQSVKRMLDIPEQLRGCRFFFLEPNKKKPKFLGSFITPDRYVRQSDGTWFDTIRQKKYITTSGEPYKGELQSKTYDEMCEALQKENIHSIGVVCGYNNLIVVDADDALLDAHLQKQELFSKTFSVKSAHKQLHHYYFYVESPHLPTARYVKNTKSKSSLCDIQGMGTFVVAPNSVFVNGENKKEYLIDNTNEIAHVQMSEILSCIDDAVSFLGLNVQRNTQNPYTKKIEALHPIDRLIFSKINTTKVLEEWNVDVSTNPGDSPFVQSKSKKCLHRTGHLFFDHHLGKGGTVVTLYELRFEVSKQKARQMLVKELGITDEEIAQAIKISSEKNKQEFVSHLTDMIENNFSVITIEANEKQKDMFVRENNIYNSNARPRLQCFLESLLPMLDFKDIFPRVIFKLESRTMKTRDEVDTDKNPYEVPFKNCVVNMKTLKKRDYTDDDYFFNCCPYDYNASLYSEKSLIYEQMKLLTDDRDALLLLQWMGYSFIRAYVVEMFLVMNGGGGNGKGKLITTWEKMLGKNNVSNIDISDLQDKPFMRENLYKKQVNFSADISKKEIEDINFIKMITGRDEVTVDRKFKSALKFLNYAKIVFACNQIPDIKESDAALFRRVCLINFGKKFITKEQYQLLVKSGENVDDYLIQDDEVVEKMQTKKEIEILISKAVFACNKLLENNKSFIGQRSREETKEMWLKLTDTVYTFFQDTMEKAHPDMYEKTTDVYNEYITWCHKNNIVPKDMVNFGKSFSRMGIIKARKREMTDRINIYKGITFKKGKKSHS